MSNFALSSVILVLFVFAAGLGLGSLARAQFERRLKLEAEERQRSGAARRALTATHGAASVKQQAARKKTSRVKTAARPRSGGKGQRRGKPGGKA